MNKENTTSENEHKEAEGLSDGVGQALYWIDFKYRKEEIRLQVIAESLDDAVKKARQYVIKRFKVTRSCCMR